MPSVIIELMMGSSPLARGTLGTVASAAATTGLIPARAGNTLSRVVWILAIGAHPRSRGEHSVVCKSPWTSKGSSPLARGTLAARSSVLSRVGLIPARAGNTAFLRRVRARLRAHPRSRGEHAAVLCVGVILSGSSPLARGTPANVFPHRGNNGLIPARAGNTQRHNGH